MADEKDSFSNMPKSMKPSSMQGAGVPTINSPNVIKEKKLGRGRKIAWAIVVIIGIVLVVQYVNAAKYEALVQVIAEDRIGVNPTGEKLDFGDLPRNKSALRSVILSSAGNTGSYIIVWKFGDISDLIKISRNYFTLKAHTTEKLEFTVSIPNSAEYRYYKGKVVIFQIPKVW